MDLPPIPDDTVRVAVGVVSLALLVRARQVWRLAVLGPGFLFGVVVGVLVAPALGLQGALLLGVVAGLGIAGVVAAWMVERAAVVMAGAVAGGALGIGAIALTSGAAWWALPLGVVVGALAAPALYRALVPLFGAVIGAVGVAWAAGWPRSALVLGALAAFGLIVQAVSGRANDDEGEQA
jgi:hypothetical protein